MITISQMLLTFLLNAFWQVLLIALAAVLCAKLLRGLPARYRYVLWVAALSLSILLPLLSSPLSLRGVFSSKRPPVEPPRSGRQINVPPANPPAAAPPATSAALLTVPLGANFAIGLIVLYLLFVLYRGRNIARAWRQTRAVVRGAAAAPLPDSIQKTVEKCRAAIEVEKVSILFSKNVAVPITVGIRDPLIILPEQFLEETDSNILTTAIGHELAHIRRRDYLFNLIFELVYLPLSFHPAAVLVKRRINQMRELCCDEMVAKRLLKADVYARSLVKIAGSVSNLSRPASTVTVGITDAENLEVRIMSLLNKSESSFSRKTLLIIATVLLLAVPCVVGAFFALTLGISSVSAQQTENPQSLPEHREKEEREMKARKEKIERELKALQTSQNDGSDLSERRKKLEKALVELQNNPGAMPEYREKLEKMMAERQEQSRLARESKITMEQAIQNATNYQPGVVLSSNLGRANGEVIYRIFILDKDSAEGNGTLVIVSGLDGRIVKTEKGFL